MKINFNIKGKTNDTKLIIIKLRKHASKHAVRQQKKCRKGNSTEELVNNSKNSYN